MSVEPVKVQNQSTNVAHVESNNGISPRRNILDISYCMEPTFNISYLETHLSNHPDKEFVNKLLNSAKYGVDIGYTGPRNYRESKNWPSAYKYKEAVRKSITKDVERGRKLGPFSHPPFEAFIGSPMGAFPKKRSDKYRIIHDLSWPPQNSVNDYISKEDFSVKYITIDQPLARVVKYGSGTLMSKLDLADAFKHILVRQRDWELLGSVWEDTDSAGNKVKEYYVDTVLPFGLRSSPKLFNDFAEALQFIMEKQGVSDVDHYLDDYFTCGPPNSNICRSNLDTMLAVCDEFGFEVNPSKTECPTTCLELLGIIIDSELMQVRISKERLKDCVDELNEWQNRKICTKRQLLSLIGRLMFVSRVVRSGRTFVRRLIELSKKVKHLHYKVKLNKDAQQDILWWIKYLPNWNGISVIPDQKCISNTQLQLWTDASDVGYGAYFDGEWIQERFIGKKKQLAINSINWRELYAIVKAAATWGHLFVGKSVCFHCDNMSIVNILQKGTSKCPCIMKLVRALFYIGAKYDFVCTAVFIRGTSNGIADALSRFENSRFRDLAPNAQILMTVPGQIDIIDC